MCLWYECDISNRRAQHNTTVGCLLRKNSVDFLEKWILEVLSRRTPEGIHVEIPNEILVESMNKNSGGNPGRFPGEIHERIFRSFLGEVPFNSPKKNFSRIPVKMSCSNTKKNSWRYPIKNFWKNTNRNTCRNPKRNSRRGKSLEKSKEDFLEKSHEKYLDCRIFSGRSSWKNPSS